MTLFLASVAGTEEAELALVHGADVIELKDAAKGALGAVAPDAVAAAVRAVAGRRPVGAAAGDLPMQPDAIAAAVAAMAATGVDYVKVGLFPDARREECINALSALARKIKIVGVMFADHGADEALAPPMAAAGFAGAMLDTARKRVGLLEQTDIPSLRQFVGACRANNLTAGLAGSLEAPDIPRLLLLAPDYLGFRGALCVGQDRTAGIDPEAVAVIRGLIPLDERSAAYEGPVGKVDYRLLAARGQPIDQSKDEVATDRVFVHDFVLPARIGAYARERANPQSVRFNVDAKVLRSGHVPEDMRDVFSYDVIIDGIRMIVAKEHIPLVETLAERVAALVLAHARVMEVTVRVDKLDVGPGAVGVEITRARPAEAAKIHQLYPSVTDPKVAE